jgi:hypothetical protein
MPTRSIGLVYFSGGELFRLFHIRVNPPAESKSYEASATREIRLGKACRMSRARGRDGGLKRATTQAPKTRHRKRGRARKSGTRDDPAPRVPRPCSPGPSLGSAIARSCAAPADLSPLHRVASSDCPPIVIDSFDMRGRSNSWGNSTGPSRDAARSGRRMLRISAQHEDDHFLVGHVVHRVGDADAIP